MGRRTARTHIFILIFQKEFHDDYNPVEMTDDYLKELNLGTYDQNFIMEEVQGICENIAEIDEHIKNNIKGWTFNRLSKIDISILRVGIYEILFADSVPDKVAINEAIEIAKIYSYNNEDESSHKFINGVLGRVMEIKQSNDKNE